MGCVGEYMLEIISSKLKRELIIVEFLYKNREMHSVDELIRLTEVTERTIRADIERINENFPSLHIEISKKNQIKLECPDSIGLEYIYRKAMNISIEFNFFEQLLTNPKQTMNFYIKKLFISESLLRKIVHKWNKIFIKRELNALIITFPVVAIEGDEMTIRKLYHRYLVEKYERNFQQNFLKAGSTWEMMTRIGKTLSIEIPYPEHLKFSHWIFVCVSRIKCGYFLKKNNYSERGAEIAKLLYNDISKDVLFIEQFKYNYQVSMSVETLLDILDVLDYDLLLSSRLTKDIDRYEQKELGISMKALNFFLLSLYDSIGFENSSLEQTLAFLYNFLLFQYRVPFFFRNRFGEFREYIKKESPSFLTMFEYCIETSTLPNYLKENTKLRNEFLYFTVTHTDSLLEMLPKLSIRKKILILTTFHHNYENVLKEKIENVFEGSLSVSLYHSEEFQFDVEYLKQFDLILTNYEHMPKELENKIIFIDMSMSAYIDFFEKIEAKLK